MLFGFMHLLSQDCSLVRFNKIPPSHCCSVTVLGGVFTRRLVVVSGCASLVVLRSTACIISPRNIFCERIVPDKNKQKTLGSITSHKSKLGEANLKPSCDDAITLHHCAIQ